MDPFSEEEEEGQEPSSQGNEEPHNENIEDFLTV